MPEDNQQWPPAFVPAGERIAALEMGQRQLQEHMEAMRADVREMRDAIVGAKGSIKFIGILLGIAGAVGACVTWALSHLHLSVGGG